MTSWISLHRPLANQLQSGGVALTLTVTYLSVLAHQRTREQQSAAIRAQALQLQGIVDPLPAALPPTRAQIAAAERATSFEVAKDRWNHEVENAVRWVQRTDWNEVREELEYGVSNLWGKITGETPAEAGERVKARVGATGSGVAAAAKDAYEQAKIRTVSVEEAAENKVLEARLKTVREVNMAEDVAKDKASEAKSTLASVWESGKERAKDLADRAKAAVSPVGDKAEFELSPVEKALRQRYEQPEAKANKTVAEALKERYTPIDKLDNTKLKGV